MVLHEMATNAVKHGSLSGPDGELRVSWQTEGDTSLRLIWTESGGPTITSPIVPGFGSELILSSISYTLQGKIEQEYAPDCFRAELVIPLDGSEGP